MEPEKKKVYEIKPLGKWKRILLFLGDYFMTFIIAFALFNLVVFPLAKVIIRSDTKNAKSNEYEKTANQMLIDKGLLFASVDSDPTFINDVNYTFKVFLSYYAFDDESVDETYKQYGHKENNEVIRNYFVGLKNDEASYIAAFKENNQYCEEYKKQGFSFFEVGETVDSIKLKSSYKSTLGAELLEQKDEDKYTDTMKQFRDNVFARLFYMKVYDEIVKNDLVLDGVSYNGLLAKIDKIDTELQWTAIVSVLLSPVLAWTFAYLIYPLINHDHRTPTMSIMKLDRLNFANLGPINRKVVVVYSFYALLASFSYIIFLPTLYFGFMYIFNLPVLFIANAVSLAAVFAMFLSILINQHNRSGSDILTFTVVVPTAELDNLYREKLEDGCLSSQGTDEGRRTSND